MSRPSDSPRPAPPETDLGRASPAGPIAPEGISRPGENQGLSGEGPLPQADAGIPWEEMRDEIIGLGRRSIHKSYYAQLQRRMSELEELLEGTISALATMGEIRDPYTGGHQRRVAHLAEAVAREMGLPPDRVETVRIAGMLHDIGKISVPIEILNKPRALSPSEFAVIQIHPAAGFEILKAIRFRGPVAEAVLQHHERLDGSGYPSGLTGPEILLEARILAVADVVEAMTYHRPYRPALGVQAALDEIASLRGARLDAEVVDACLALFREGENPMDALERD